MSCPKWKQPLEKDILDQGFFGNHYLVAGRIFLGDHEATKWLILNDYCGDKYLWVSDKKW